VLYSMQLCSHFTPQWVIRFACVVFLYRRTMQDLCSNIELEELNKLYTTKDNFHSYMAFDIFTCNMHPRRMIILYECIWNYYFMHYQYRALGERGDWVYKSPLNLKFSMTTLKAAKQAYTPSAYHWNVLYYFRHSRPT
jgi:hypothetical protein